MFHLDSLMYLPLADATVITFLAPVIACWACSLILKEPFTKMEQIAAMISLFGVVLIARPASLFYSNSGTAPPANGGGDVVPLGNATAVAVAGDRFSYDHVRVAHSTYLESQKPNRILMLLLIYRLLRSSVQPPLALRC
jgi:drug/metabolite transporter (DMT)-like permease